MNGRPSRAPLRSIRAAGRRGAGAARRTAFLALPLLLMGCAETGDLGRPRSSVWSDAVLPAAGGLAARYREEPVSGSALTDDEDELRRRAWRFLMPAHERAWFDRQVAALVRARVLPAAWRPRARAAYLAALEADPIRSPIARYRRLAEDVAADHALVVPFAVVAARVIETDRLRRAAIPLVRDAEAARVASATARMAENRCLVAAIREALADRIEAYGHALAHLFIETPDHAGIEPERALADLRLQATVLDALPVPALAACAGAVAVAAPVPPPVPRTVIGK